MKVKALVALLVLVFSVIPALMIPAPVSAFSLGLEPITGKVGATIKIPAFCQYGEGDYSLYWGDDNVLIAQGTVQTKGCSPIYFAVPQTTRGKHTVTLKVGSKSWSRDFTVTGGITLDINKGPVGTLITVQGCGFADQESNISVTYDGNNASKNVQANHDGTWTYKLKIPPSNRGGHPISAGGPTTSQTEVGNKAFDVAPSIAVSPSSGWVGRVVNVSGYGFDNGESGIAVIYDNTTVKSGLIADSAGSWQSSFSIPSSSKGTHRLDAYGTISPAADVQDISFNVAPGIHVEQASRNLGENIRVGDTLVISGIGFQGNESNIIITLDNLQIVDKVTADAQGSWSVQFTVGAASYGNHVISASGDSTRSSDVTGFTIFIKPDLTINPDTGAVGDSMVLVGTGFSSNQPLTFIYDFKKITASASTDFKGNINTSFKPPVSSAGPHTLMVTDEGGAASSVTLTIESTPPEAPSPISPDPSSAYSFFDTAPIEFTWSAVEDPSGVTYTIEIAQKEDFSGPVIRKEKLEKPEYKMQRSERPAFGNYYWRVKAIDLAGNTGDWSKVRSIEFSGSILVWGGGIGLGVLVIILLIIWRIRAISKKGGWKSDTDS
jgi:hypothetical protein